MVRARGQEMQKRPIRIRPAGAIWPPSTASTPSFGSSTAICKPAKRCPARQIKTPIGGNASTRVGISCLGTEAIWPPSRPSCWPKSSSSAAPPTGPCPTGTTATAPMPRRATYPPVSSPRPCRTAAPIHYGWRSAGWNNQPNHITLRPETVQLTALKDAQFIGTANGIPPGYGGPQTPFWHGGGNSGGLENLPHNPVHTNIGGRNGLMSDRTWPAWTRCSGSITQYRPAVAGMAEPQPRPSEPRQRQLAGGAGQPQVRDAASQRQRLHLRRQDVLNTQAPNLNYVYQDVSDPLAAPAASRSACRRWRRSSRYRGGKHHGEQSENRAAGRQHRGDQAEQQHRPRADAVGQRRQEQGAEQLPGQPGRHPPAAGAAERRAAARAAPGLPQPGKHPLQGGRRHLQRLRRPAPGADPAQYPQNLAGTIALFGARKASQAEHGGNGVSQVLEITDIVDRMCQSQTLDTAPMEVQLVPVSDIEDDDEVTIGRISVYRHGQ